MNWEKDAQFARALAEKIRQSGFKPDLIVAIEKSGVAIAEVIGTALAIPVERIRVKRPVTEKYKSKRFPGRAVVQIAKLFQRPRVWKPIQQDLRGKKVLVVDNSITSGKTIQVTQAHLIEKGVSPENVRVATLYYLKRWLRKSNPPDFFLTHRRSRLFRPKPPGLRRAK